MKNFSARILFSLPLIAALAAGCVERMITVHSDPPGALVWLNGEEIGRTPVTVHFLEYGVYEVVLRREGYETIRTPRAAEAPLYQIPPLDLFFECFYPGRLTDHHNWRFEMSPAAPADPNALIQRAAELREAALTTAAP